MPPPSGGNGDFPLPGGPSKKTTGLYIIVQANKEGENLEKVSPILIEKTIKANFGEVETVKKTRDGKILILTKNEKQAIQLMKLTKIGNNDVTASEHRSLNTCRVVISNRDLMYEEDVEIEKALKPQGVIKVERITRRKGAETQKTASLILTVKSNIPPEKVKVGYLVIPTRPYYPRPLRCYNCLQFGHIGKVCKSEKRCLKCSKTFHGDVCNEEDRCINCEEQHSALSNKCNKYMDEIKIIKLKVDKKIPFWEAKKIVEEEKKNSYAEETKKSLEEEYINAAIRREEEMKEIIDEYQKKISKLEEKLQNLNENFNKAMKKIAEEKAKRKQAETEFDNLNNWVQQQQQQNSQASPIRKRPCKKIEDGALQQYYDGSSDGNESENG